MSVLTKICLTDLLPVSESYEIVDIMEFFRDDDALQFDFTVKILDVDKFSTLSFVRVLSEKQWIVTCSDLIFNDAECSYYKYYRIVEKKPFKLNSFGG